MRIGSTEMRTDASTSREARNLMEKHRRLLLKHLFARLASLLPAQSSRVLNLDAIDKAIDYIRQLQERLRMLRKRLEQLNRKRENNPPEIITIGFGSEVVVSFRVTEGNKSIMLQQVLQAMEVEGAQVQNLSYSTVGGQVFGTIRAEAINARIGIDIPNITERLNKLDV